MTTALVLYQPPQFFYPIEVKVEVVIQKCDNYIVEQTFRYNTMGPLGLQTIEVVKGDVLQRIIDEPHNFSNGFTILSEKLILENPNLFTQAYFQ